MDLTSLSHRQFCFMIFLIRKIWSYRLAIDNSLFVWWILKLRCCGTWKIHQIFKCHLKAAISHDVISPRAFFPWWVSVINFLIKSCLKHPANTYFLQDNVNYLIAGLHRSVSVRQVHSGEVWRRLSTSPTQLSNACSVESVRINLRSIGNTDHRSV